jgi:hypothetical protein
MFSNSAEQLFNNDAQIKDIAYDKYSKTASDESIEKFKKAAEDKKWEVVVVENRAEALAHIKSYIPKDAEVMNCGSTTLVLIPYSSFYLLMISKRNKLASMSCSRPMSTAGRIYTMPF